MAPGPEKLDITTLGGLSIKRNGEEAAGHVSRKASALLVYLACTAKSHPREQLAELLWEERAPGRSLANLRVLLTSLRKELGSFIRISRDALSIDASAGIRLDIWDLERVLDMRDLYSAAEIYQGDFLNGFYIRGASEFDKWVSAERARLHQVGISALHQLLDSLILERQWEQGIKNANRLIELEPFDESAHRKLMKLFYINGQRSSALALYESLKKTLKDELGVEPEASTIDLYNKIQSGELEIPAPDQIKLGEVEIKPELPPFLEAGAASKSLDLPVFVARKAELSGLYVSLSKALHGEGRVVFITGGPGRGKTALLNEFSRQASEQVPALLVLKGACSAYSGLGDPYLPFREILNLLAGDLEGAWRAGTLNHDQTLRLWSALPGTIPALISQSPDLLRSFVNLNRLSKHAKFFAPDNPAWGCELQQFMDRKVQPTEPLEQQQLFQQFSNLLLHISNTYPMVLVLDDMQWADTASISLLFHLGRRLTGSSILIACAYRPEEVALGRDGRRHPLEKVLNEFKRQYGDVWLDLGKLESFENKSFVEQYLDQEPNRLTSDFRKTLIEHTAGHPLFTIELLREMREQNNLIKQDGEWVIGPALDWELLPPRVEGVIEERIGRLEDNLLELLKIACVEGEFFTAQVLARVSNREERQVIGSLSRELEQRHRLIHERGLIQVGDHYLARYQFSHIMFHAYLYENLSEGERTLLHADIGSALRELYSGASSQVVHQLARHFLEGGRQEDALPYLIQAGDKARALYAASEAEWCYRQAAQIQHERGQIEETARTYLKLGLVYTAAYEAEKAQYYYDRAFELWSPLRETSKIPLHRAPTAVLRFAMEEPRTLDPGLADDDISSFFISQIFEGLVRIGRDYNVIPAAAERWETNEDGTCYVFHLKEGALWNDDSYLTAVDFINAWRRNLRLKEETGAVNLLYAIKNARAFRENTLEDLNLLGIKALDDLVLEVTLEEPTPYLPYLIAHPIFYPLPTWVIERYAENWTLRDNITTNGPYEISDWIPGKRIILTENPLYKGEYVGNVRQVEISTHETIWPALEDYKAGELDAICLFNADPGTIIKAMNSHRSEVVTIPRPSTLYLNFRSDQPPFDDMRVRRAFVYAVDRQELAIEAGRGLYTPATGGFVPPGMVGYSPDIGLAFDPDLGRSLLAQAGYPGGKGFPEITWLQPTASEDERIVPYLRQSWHEVLGVKLDSESMEWPEYYQRFTNDPAHLTIMGWGADYPDPDNMLRITFHSKEGLNAPRWCDPRFDTLVENAKRVTDQDQRMQLYSQADKILVAEQAVIMPIGYSRGWMLVKPWVTLPYALSCQMPFNRFILDTIQQKSGVHS